MNDKKIKLENNRKIRLGVNIDHVATLRNARGVNYPDPVFAAKLALQAGADGITAHLREDRRHIKDDDIKRLKEEISLPLNLEMAATNEMVLIASSVKPNACCIVPEKREELTTEGGLNVVANKEKLKKYIDILKKHNIKISLFIDPDIKQLEAAKEVGADIVELHTGTYCDNFIKERHIAKSIKTHKELKRLFEAAKYTEQLSLECHAGHGLTYETVGAIANIQQIKELNIGHFIIAESVFVGLEDCIKTMRYFIEDSLRVV